MRGHAWRLGAVALSLLLVAGCAKAPPDSAETSGTPQATVPPAATFTPAASALNDPPVKLATSFLASLRAGDAKAAEADWDFSGLTAREKNTQQDSFEEWASKHQPASYKLVNAQYYQQDGTAVTTSADAASANVTYDTTGGALPATVVLKVTKEGGDWKITDLLTAGR